MRSHNYSNGKGTLLRFDVYIRAKGPCVTIRINLFLPYVILVIVIGAEQ